MKRKNSTLSDKAFIGNEHFKLTDYLLLPRNYRPKLKPDTVPSKSNFLSHKCEPFAKNRDTVIEKWYCKFKQC